MRTVHGVVEEMLITYLAHSGDWSGIFLSDGFRAHTQLAAPVTRPRRCPAR